ncbi:transcriptional repressor [Deltaproteobacteria bacterium Smac51]|nr:transcriptional repressor [Deltaproteobacteria bacterium Smac51]
MPPVKYEHFKEVCQARGLKATSQRFVIFKTLASTACHPTADQLFDMVSGKLPGLSRDTVYRTLNVLAECGMLRKLIMPGGATHFDGDTTPHHHFLCEQCGQILDFEWPDFDNLPWPEAIGELGRAKTASVLIMGRCLGCEVQ